MGNKLEWIKVDCNDDDMMHTIPENTFLLWRLKTIKEYDIDEYKYAEPMKVGTLLIEEGYGGFNYRVLIRERYSTIPMEYIRCYRRIEDLLEESE